MHNGEVPLKFDRDAEENEDGDVPEPVKIYLEVGARRAFAAALDWPGWCRPGKTPDAAIETLLAAGARYRKTVGSAARGPALPREPAGIEIVQRVTGDATTDFGAPSKEVRADAEPLDDAGARRFEKLLRACWTGFDRSAEAAVGIELRKGPRGGGRELDAIIEHVRDADAAYLRSFGAQAPKPAGGDPRQDLGPLREAILAAFRSRARGEPPQRVPRSGKVWSPRYLVRRSAWHAVDHAWEIEDRSS